MGAFSVVGACLTKSVVRVGANSIIYGTAKEKKKKVKAEQDENWKNNGRKDRREFLFTGTPGINLNYKDTSDIVEVFKSFLTDEIVGSFVKFTNDYAEALKTIPEIQEYVNEKSRSLLAQWTPVDIDEMWMYFAISFIMGIVQKPNMDFYWTNGGLFQTPIFTRLMPRTKYREIRSMVHFFDSINYDSSDPLLKLRYMLDNLSEKFLTNYTPGRNVAIDEYLSLWKGRLSFKIYVPSKRERYGVKLYMLNESDSGYLRKFIIYTAASTKYPPFTTTKISKDFDDFKNPSKVVLSLMDELFDEGYKLTLDNFYTSPEVAKALLEAQTDCFGTLRKKEGQKRGSAIRFLEMETCKRRPSHEKISW